MKRRKIISIKQRIYWSFLFLVSLLVMNSIITILTINKNKKLSKHISEVVDPTIQVMSRFKNMLVESKIYTTNWVFLRTDFEDKKQLIKIHESGYRELKENFNLYATKCLDEEWIDSLNRIYTGFEQLLVIEKNIMSSLNKFEDYDDPVIKLEAERKVEEEILPRTAALINYVNEIHAVVEVIKETENTRLEKSGMKLRTFILILAFTTICTGLLLSIYMTKVIIRPINVIRHIITNLGKGMIQKIGGYTNNDEIGKMVSSVNSLSENLESKAVFAEDVGRRNFDTHFKPLSNQDTLGKALIVMRDNIKSSDQKLNEAQHIARLGSWERNIETDEVTLSDEMFNIFDCDPLTFDFQFQSILKLIHPGDIGNVKETMQKNRSMTPVPIECRIITSKGLVKDILVETKMRLGKYGEIEKTLGVVKDITERKAAETKLNKIEERYRQIVETAQEGIWLIDENDCTSFVNKKMCEISGYPKEELLGKKIYHFMDEESSKNALVQIERRKLGISEIHDSVLITKTGKRVWVTISTNPVFNEEGIYKGALAMMTDITKRKHDEELLQKSQTILATNNQELEQKNKELEQFAYVASHDLQEPLRTTTRFVELLQLEYKGKLDEKADKYLTYITQSSSRMEVLIKDLLDYSRIGHKKELQKVDCNKILQNVLADLGTAIAETQAIVESESLPVINGYPTEMMQLFQNLIANAIKFRKKDIIPKIKITARNKKDCWEFALADNGIGIEQKHRDRIFIIFQRLHTRTEYQGSGIGLSHCKKIAELHKGKIWVESIPGEGSVFYFTICS